jgi:hypothetical protein
MKSFKNCAAQGDVLFRRIDKLPDDATPQPSKTVAHSETGHHHSFDADASVFLYTTADQMLSYLEVKQPAALKHRRDFDTHEEILFDVGTYEIRRQREWAPEGWRKVVD